jgi:CRP/FNR family transcriptional regulator
LTREEIGSYLGLTIESISRLLSRFKKNGWLNVESKEIQINDLPKLKTLVTASAAESLSR